MREEYNISELNPRKNPYASRLKKQITINIDGSTIDYFKSLAESKGIPYQTLINLYLRDCATNRRQLQISWQQEEQRIMIVRITLEERGAITQEEIEILERASKMPILFDEDSPKLTGDELKEFCRATTK